MSRPAGKMGGGQGNQDTAPWTAIIVVAGVVVTWLALHKQIAWVVLWLRYLEAHLLYFDPVGRQALVEWLGKTTAAQAGISGLFQSGMVAGYSLRWFSLVLLIGWFGFLAYKSPARGGRYAKHYDIDSLAVQESASWPVIRPVLNLNLAHVGLDDPLNGMRQTPRAYCRKHDLLLPRWTAADQLREHLDARQLDDKDYFLTGRAVAVLEAQVGRPWEGIERLRPYERTLFAAFAAQMCHKEKVALDIINAVAANAEAAFAKSDPSLLEPPMVAEALATYGAAESVSKVLRRHAYVRTVLMRMLEEAQKNGVLNSGLFRWLKMADRVTWYCLNDMGLSVASAEACGVRAHYYAERAAKTAVATKIVKPAVDGLIDALNQFLDDIASGDEDEDE